MFYGLLVIEGNVCISLFCDRLSMRCPSMRDIGLSTSEDMITANKRCSR